MYPRLKALRKSLGMTQEDFGKSLNIAKSTYNNYEKGKRDPGSDFWIEVAKKYNVTIDYLMGFSENSSKDQENLNKDNLSSVPAQNKKAPTHSNVEADARRIYRALISAGLLKEGEDLTPKQVEGLTGIAMMISALFDR